MQLLWVMYQNSQYGITANIRCMVSPGGDLHYELLFNLIISYINVIGGSLHPYKYFTFR